MKKRSIELIYSVLAFVILSLVIGTCSDYGYNDPSEDLNFAPNLYGTWSYTNVDGTPPGHLIAMEPVYKVFMAQTMTGNGKLRMNN